ncbi:MAG TPA: amidase family protein, partial [Solirubrobacteraceae bacterium]|nr:amidase family protein [Solirubrobacteraceae bacterium]
PERSFAAQAAQSPGGMRIAVTCSSPIPDVSVDPIAAGAVDEAAALLRELGHEVLEIDPPWPGRELQEAFGVMFCVLIALGIQQAAQLAGGREPVESDVEPMNWAIWQRCQRIEGMRLEAARAHMLTLARRLIAELERYDAVLTPALAERPLPLGSLPTDAPQPMSTFSRSGRFTPFTQIFNVTGQPAVSVPLLQGPDGLPLAVQLAGRPAQEGPLLALAAQLEQARPWAGRRPPL